MPKFMVKLFKKNIETIDDVIHNNDCNNLMAKVQNEYSKQMTGLIVIVEINKQTYWHCAGMETAQAILSLDQLHHRVQHEGLQNYD